MEPTQRQKRSGLNLIDRRLLILLSMTPLGCFCAVLVGLLITWYVFPTRFVNVPIQEIPQQQSQDFIIMVAADFAEHHDLERAEALLAELEVPNPPQYVAMVADQLVRENHTPTEDIENVARLADALGVSTVSLAPYVATATPPPALFESSPEEDTPVPLPTSDHPTNTPEAVPTNTPEAVPTDTPETAPTDTPEPEPTEPPPPVPEVVEVAAAAPTEAIEATPTETPAPSASEFDFVVKKQRLLTKDENGGCMGMHSIFITVIDAAGNPLRGAEIGEIWGNPGPTTGHKGDDNPGLAVWDLYKNGFHVFVKSDPSAGRPVTSETTELLSSNDWEIGIPRLIEAGYCRDEGECRVLWNSGVFGEGNNSLCWGHYSWEVTFQRTW
jgi:hypothetical protein